MKRVIQVDACFPASRHDAERIVGVRTHDPALDPLTQICLAPSIILNDAEAKVTDGPGKIGARPHENLRAPEELQAGRMEVVMMNVRDIHIVNWGVLNGLQVR